MATPPFPADTDRPRGAMLRKVATGAILIVAMIALGILMRWMDGPDTPAYRTPNWAIWVHLATVIAAVPLGAWVLWRRVKGDLAHRIGGRVWALLMVITAIDSFWIRGLTGTVGPIHVFSVITLYSIPKAIWHVRMGRIDQHLSVMRGTYFGLIAAGVVAMAPGRMIWTTLFG
jgi:uncharacterized membrane protein